jgi:hypothetical protein
MTILNLFKFLLNNYKNFIYLNSNKIKINIWFFIHMNILYIYQRTSIMVWLNTLNTLASKYIKIIRFNFDFLSLYKSSIMYIFLILGVALFI